MSDEMKNVPETAPDVDPKAVKFVELANQRGGKVIDGFEKLSKLSSSAYHYTPEQIDKLFAVMSDSMKKAYASFQPKAAAVAVKREIL